MEIPDAVAAFVATGVCGLTTQESWKQSCPQAVKCTSRRQKKARAVPASPLGKTEGAIHPQTFRLLGPYGTRS